MKSRYEQNRICLNFNRGNTPPTKPSGDDNNENTNPHGSNCD